MLAASIFSSSHNTFLEKVIKNTDRVPRQIWAFIKQRNFTLVQIESICRQQIKGSSNDDFSLTHNQTTKF